MSLVDTLRLFNLPHDSRYPLRGFTVACRISGKFRCDDVHEVGVVSAFNEDLWAGNVVEELRQVIHVPAIVRAP